VSLVTKLEGALNQSVVTLLQVFVAYSQKIVKLDLLGRIEDNAVEVVFDGSVSHSTSSRQ
jgi:hypothetical protein